MENKFLSIIIVLLAASLSLMFSSCSSSEDPDFSLDGEWTIYSREIKCSAPDASAGAAETLRKDLAQKFKSGMAANNYIYIFGDVYDTQESLYEFAEKAYKKDSESQRPVLSIEGSYKRTNEGLTMYVGNLGVWDNWESKLNIVDLNNEHVMFTQNLTSRDLEIILYAYFGSLRTLDTNITGVLTTKATKNKKTE